MRPSEFLETATDLAAGAREADWRSCISRAYYALHHELRAVFARQVDRRLLVKAGSTKPSHDFIIRCLRKCRDADVNNIGEVLNDLRTERNDADYDLARMIGPSRAGQVLGDAKQLVRRIAGVGRGRIAEAVSSHLESSEYG